MDPTKQAYFVRVLCGSSERWAEATPTIIQGLSMQAHVSFQLVMGSANPGQVRTGSVVDLYGHFFDVARAYVPPFEVLNEKLATGRDDAGEHGILLRWDPFQINRSEYAEFRECLRASTVRRYEQVEAPPELQSWDDWSRWIYTTQIHPKLPVLPAGSPSRNELALRRHYRRALAAGDALTADAVLAEIRLRYDPSFS